MGRTAYTRVSGGTKKITEIQKLSAIQLVVSFYMQKWGVYHGIGYVDSVVVYNRYLNRTMGEAEYYFGTRFDNVRVELTQGANQKASGMENASVCVVKIPNNGNLPKPYKAPEVWNDLTTEEMTESFTLDTTAENFFIITKKAELGIDIDVPLGLVESDTYMPNGFFEWIKNKYGYAFGVDTVDVYNLIPRFEIGGR